MKNPFASTHIIKFIFCAIIASSLLAASDTAASDTAVGELVITSDTIQNGGTLTISPPGSLGISSPTNPLLVLTGGASTSGVLGVQLNGELLVTDSSILKSGAGRLLVDRIGGGSYQGPATSLAGGTATVLGAGSAWEMIAGANGDQEVVSLDIGEDGALYVLHGGRVSVQGSARIEGRNSLIFQWSAAATVSGAGSLLEIDGSLSLLGDSTLTISNGGEVVTGTLRASPSQLLGNGTISTKGVVLGGYDLVFNETRGLQQTFNFGSGGGVLGNGGEIRLDLDGTGRLGVGFGESGSLRIADGVTVVSTMGELGSAGGTGEVTGAGSQWINSSLTVRSASALSINNGGVVTSRGRGNVEGKASVLGIGSKWIVAKTTSPGLSSSGSLYVDGTLTVSDGGEVVVNTLEASSLDDFQGNGTIFTKGIALGGYDLVFDSTRGLQQIINFGDGGQINLDMDGTGTLGTGQTGHRGGMNGTITIADGMKVVSQRGFIEGSTRGTLPGMATITGVGSTWESEYITVGFFSPRRRESDGILSIRDGATVSVSGLTVEAGGSLLSEGGRIIGDVLSNGIIGMDDSTGTLDIDGNLSLPSVGRLNTGSILRFGIASLTDFSQINISGEMRIGGMVEVYLLDGFNPLLDSEFDLVDFGSFVDSGYVFDFTSAILGNDAWKWDTRNFAANGTIGVIAVPEPSSIALLLLSTIGLIFVMSRSKRHELVQHGCLALTVVAGGAALKQDCQAAFIVTAEAIGDDVVITGSGSFTAWQWDADGFSFGNIDPGASGFFDGVGIGFGNAGDIASEVEFAFIDSFDVPETLGADIPGTFASIFSGDPFGVGVSNFSDPEGVLILGAPRNYVAGTELTGVMTFDGASLESLGLVPGTYVFSWTIGLITDTLTIEVAAKPGDFDGDGDVDGGDFLAWQRNSTIGTLEDWETNFGSGGAALASSVANVPEPSTTVLAGLALAVFGIQRTRFKHPRGPYAN